MRRHTIINHPETKRVMIYSSSEGCFVFLFDSEEDGPCYADHWFENEQAALEYVKAEYAVKDKDWIDIGDPKLGQNDDRLS